MMAGAPILTAQLHIQKIQQALNGGDHNILEGMNMATRGTAGEFVRFLSQATSIGVLKLINKKQADMVARSLSLAAEGLDYSQALLNVIGNKASVSFSLSKIKPVSKRHPAVIQRESFNSDNKLCRRLYAVEQ